MVVYEVNLKFNLNRAEESRHWLAEHVQEMLTLPGFQSAEIFREELSQADSCCWSVHYRLESREALENYFREYAAAMRQQGLDRFGECFTAARRILLPDE